MSDYFTYFSTEIPVKTEDEVKFIEEKIEQWTRWYNEEEEPPPELWIECPCMTIHVDGRLIIKDDCGASSVECATYVISEWQKKFDIKEEWFSSYNCETSVQKIGQGFVLVHRGIVFCADNGESFDEGRANIEREMKRRSCLR